jgi:guanylate kinase
MKKEPQLRFSVSYTTRQRRPTEKEGHDYFFVDAATFDRMAQRGEFLEHARVFDNSYATSREQVRKATEAGIDLILEIDWQGAQQVRRAMPESISIFILPPSRAALEERLRNRGTDTEEVIQRRLRDAVADMAHWDEYDYVIVNEDFDDSVKALQAIVNGKAEAYRRDRPDLPSQVAALLG